MSQYVRLPKEMRLQQQKLLSFCLHALLAV